MSASTDVESQSPAGRSRSRCLDTFLIVSVIALFVMFMVALAGAFYFVKHIENEMNARPTRDGATGSLAAPLPQNGNAYKMQNFAYLRATKSKLETGVMAWESFPYGRGQSIGSLYTYDKNQDALNVRESGSYFLYVQLKFSCTGICKSGHFTIAFYNQHNMKELTCSVSLPEWSEETPQSQTCWRVVTFPENENRLIARSELKDSPANWQLTMNDSGFGMFLVDGLQSVHHTRSQQA